MKKIIIESCVKCPYASICVGVPCWCKLLACHVIKSQNEKFMANCPLENDHEAEAIGLLKQVLEDFCPDYSEGNGTHCEHCLYRSECESVGNIKIAALLARIEKEGK